MVLALTLACAGPARSESHGGIRGILAMHADGSVIDSENSEQLFVPASVQKLLVVAAAFHHLGPEHRIVTRVLAGGKVADGVLTGDLIVQAAADPSWGDDHLHDTPDAPVRELARQVLAAGVTRVSGDLVIDTSGFPGRSYPASRPIGELALGYSAPTSALAVDGNTVRVRIAAGRRAGDPGLVSGPEGIEWLGRVVTVSAERHGKGTVEFLPLWDTETVIVRGEYPISEAPMSVVVSVPSPDGWAGQRLRSALLEAGVVVEGGVRVETRGAAQRTLVPLASIESPPLEELAVPILTDSENWYAEMLLRVLARAVTGEGRVDTGLEVVAAFLEQEVGVSSRYFELDDASGLSLENLIAPHAVVELLRWIWGREWRERFVHAMATPGKGTLRWWPGLPPVAAKTGTLKNTLSLAGILMPEGQSPTFFACFLNHRPGRRPPQRVEIGRLLRHWQVQAGVPAASE